MSNSSFFLSVKDHSVSGETFKLYLNEELQCLETIPKLTEDKLANYYKSENYISHTDNKRNLFERLYHLVRSITLKQKVGLIDSLQTTTKELLDVGCGTGDFLLIAKNKGWNVSGIEPNDQARSIATEKVGEHILSNTALNEFDNHSFNVITLWHVLEHLPDFNEQIKLFKQKLKTDGRLVIAVPNYKSYDAQLYKEYWAAYDVPRHLWHFSRHAISKIFSSIEMEVEQILPMRFDAYYVSMLSEKYRNSSIGFLKGFYNGWLSNRSASRSGEYSSLIYVLKNRNSPLE